MEEKSLRPRRFQLSGREVEVYPSAAPNRPIIYLNAYLELPTREIMPEAEGLAEGTVSWRGLAGYSLAGLFALYAMYRTDLFSRIASMSGPSQTSSTPAPATLCCNIPSVPLTFSWRRCSPVF